VWNVEVKRNQHVESGGREGTGVCRKLRERRISVLKAKQEKELTCRK
jgi:hypothetical protein